MNFRSGPSKTTSRIASFPGGKELIATGETNSWFRAKDPDTGKEGYIMSQFLVSSKPGPKPTPDPKKDDPKAEEKAEPRSSAASPSTASST